MQVVAGSRRRWRRPGRGRGTCGQCTRWRASRSTCFGRLPVIMQHKFCSPVQNQLRRRGGASASQVPTVFRCSRPGLWERFNGKVVDVPVVTRCSMRLVEEFHFFSTCSRCSHGFSYVISTRSLYLAVTACGSLRCFWKNFIISLREGGLGFRCAVRTLKIWTIFLLAVIWRWEGFSGGFDAFFALLQVVWS